MVYLDVVRQAQLTKLATDFLTHIHPDNAPRLLAALRGARKHLKTVLSRRMMQAKSFPIPPGITAFAKEVWRKSGKIARRNQ